MRVVAPDVVRRAMARAILARDDVEAKLGEIELRPHQRAAAARLVALIDAHGGAMLADPVGLGKTYTALAVAAREQEPIVVIAPAALRAMWTDALGRCRLTATLVTHEALSRGVRVSESPGFVIVDEAHRARSPSTRRYAALAELCRRARVLLVSATPVHNAQADLAAELALFVGRAAWSMTAAELARYVVRGTEHDAHALPRLDGPRRVTLDIRDDCLDELLALPPPIPAKDEGVAAALLAYGLVHQWTSSRAALLAALERRRARGLALANAVDAGRLPTRSELGAWTHASGALQLAFPELVTLGDGDVTTHDVDALRLALDRHDAAVAHLVARLKCAPNPDVERAALLRRLRAAHPGERIIAFCHYSETVTALRSLLAADSGVAALTASGARIASGRVSRESVLAHFSPSHDTPQAESHDARASERVELLIATDLLSEGLNLQEASVVVHLDFPWNPARLDQRVGRVLRLGSRHRRVTVYAVAPPIDAERLLRIEGRLREKLSVAQRSVGVAGRILPSLLDAEPTSPSIDSRSPAERSTAVEQLLRAWHDPGSPARASSFDAPIVCTLSASVEGLVALVGDRATAHLVADIGDGLDDAPATVERALSASNGNAVDTDTQRAEIALRALERWLDARRGVEMIDLKVAAAARCRRAALSRIAETLSRAPRHSRARLAPLVNAARAVATSPLAEGAERILDTLVAAQLPDEAWLRTIATFGELNARPAAPPQPTSDSPHILALLMLEPPTR